MIWAAQASSARDFSTKPVFHESDLGYALISLEIFTALYIDAPGIFCEREEKEGGGEKERAQSMRTLLSSTCYENMFSEKKEARDNFVEK